MAKKRRAIPKLVEKTIYQESDSSCSFCQEKQVASLEVHHIDSNPSNNDARNLIVVCGNCHSKITKGIISETDVATKKMELYWKKRSESEATSMRTGNSVSVTSSIINAPVANSIHITKITKERTHPTPHPPGSIGANLSLRGYIDYLVKRYFEFRRADPSFGQKRSFSHAEIHTTIARTFGFQTFFAPESHFNPLCDYIKDRIDNTILGRANHAKGIPNYHSYEEHLRRQSGIRTRRKRGPAVSSEASEG